MDLCTNETVNRKFDPYIKGFLRKYAIQKRFQRKYAYLEHL